MVILLTIDDYCGSSADATPEDMEDAERFFRDGRFSTFTRLLGVPEEHFRDGVRNIYCIDLPH